MSTYRITIPVLTEVYVLVEAPDPDQALEMVDTVPSTCHHCQSQGVGTISTDHLRWNDATVEQLADPVTTDHS